MLSPQAELIWQGRIHLGDEPGIYGDSSYTGLAVELPITLYQTSSPGPESTTLILRTKDARTFPGYPGHVIRVTLYEPDPTNPNQFREETLAAERLTTADQDLQELSISLAGRTSPYYLSVAVRIDTTVPPGLYDDFIVRSLSNRSEGFRFVASFGFHSS